jgi:hypothetical protein
VTEEQKQKQLDAIEEEKRRQRGEATRWAKEANDAFAPPGAHTKGSHEYPSPSGPSSAHNSVPPLGHRATFRKPGQ